MSPLQDQINAKAFACVLLEVGADPRDLSPDTASAVPRICARSIEKEGCQAKPAIGQFEFYMSPSVELPGNGALVGELPDAVLFDPPNKAGDKS